MPRPAPADRLGEGDQAEPSSWAVFRTASGTARSFSNSRIFGPQRVPGEGRHGLDHERLILGRLKEDHWRSSTGAPIFMRSEPNCFTCERYPRQGTLNGHSSARPPDLVASVRFPFLTRPYRLTNGRSPVSSRPLAAPAAFMRFQRKPCRPQPKPPQLPFPPVSAAGTPTRASRHHRAG